MLQTFDELDDDDSIKKDNCGGVEDEDAVDILECSSDDDKIEIEVSECTDDVCSSFSGTVSLHDETEHNDQEADSIMCTSTDPASLPFLLRKKKLTTDHWRGFLHPITWRLNSKSKELQNQAGKYERELQESFQAKQRLIDEVEVQDLKDCLLMEQEEKIDI
ncbi:Uncharacterized protein Rs2_08752 [Raphanus sativus]|nr:Uncharacterized protein Rs2_08752 [Raphanus sativus]